MSGKWELIDGVWVSKSAHNTTAQPTDRPIYHGQAPGVIIRHGLMDRIRKDNQRRFDKPTEAQIKALEQEDAEASRVPTEEIVRDTKRDLESGKIKIDPRVLHGLRGNNYEKVVPHGHITDERGVTHILPKDKLQEISQDYKTPEDLYQRMKSEAPPEKVDFQIGPATEGNIGGPSQGTVIESSLTKAKLEGRDKFRGRTY